MNEHTDQIPDSASELDRFRVTSRTEVVSLLRSLARTNQLLRMATSDGVTLLTAILRVDEETDSVLIDCARKMSANDAFVKASRIHFEGRLDKVRITFSAGRADLVWTDANMALQIPLPEDMVRLQRREDYRINTPVVNRITCVFPRESALGAGDTALPLQNLSAGGMALIDETGVSGIEPGLVFRGCRIKLPGEEMITVDVGIRTVQPLQPPKGRALQRIGCEFLEPTPAAVAAIHRFIARMERAQVVRSAVR